MQFSFRIINVKFEL
uniref:Uncharacterized protein n=1 Tax=Rhizophora mucronata TaxID=61149 RepID=A0A2P2PNR3_RHIMU